MATVEEKIAMLQELANRGEQGRIPEAQQPLFNELVRRGIVTVPIEAQTGPEQATPQAALDAIQAAEQAQRPPGRGPLGIPVTGQQLQEDVVGGLEGFLALGSSMIAEPVGGVLGLAQASSPFTEEGSGGQMVRDVKEALTFQPRTPAGKAAIGDLGEALKPIAEPLQKFQQAVGDDAFNATGSEALGAIMQTVPAAMLEMLPARKLIPDTSPNVQKFQQTQNVGDKRSAAKDIQKQADKALRESAPTSDQLFQAASKVYKQIDDLDVSVKPEVFQRFSQRISNELNELAFDPRLHPKVAAALDELQRVEIPQTTADITRLRNFAQNAVKSSDDAEAFIGRALKNGIDDLLSGLKPNQINNAQGTNVGQLYKSAGELWKRAKKSERMGDIFDDATRRIRKDNIGFKNAIQDELSNLIKRNRRTKQFSPDEIAQMEKVIKGDKRGEFLSFIGKLDLTEQQKANALVGISSFGTGIAIGGPLGVTVPAIGFVSNSLANKLTRADARLAEAVVNAGQDGQRIAREYIRRVPKKDRDSLELTELLLNRGANLNAIKSKDPLVLQAIENAKIYTPAELAIAFGVPMQLVKPANTSEVEEPEEEIQLVTEGGPIPEQIGN